MKGYLEKSLEAIIRSLLAQFSKDLKSVLCSFLDMEVKFKEKHGFGIIQLLCPCCKKKQARYVCPKCKVPYCCIGCYKAHSEECPEEFYKDQVLGLLSSQKPLKSEVKKISEILRFGQGDSDVVLDEMLEEKIENRLRFLETSNVFLENLTVDEKKEFLEFVNSGKALKYIEEWQPWWCEDIDVEEVSQSDMYVNAPDISKLHKNPSQFVIYHVFEMVWACVYVWRSFNGEIDENFNEVAEALMTFSKVLRGEICSYESVTEVLLKTTQNALDLDKEIALGISHGVLYDCYLIFSNKWKLIKIIFELYKFFQTQKLLKFFYSASQSKLKALSKKLGFFISYIKSKSQKELEILSDEVLSHYKSLRKVESEFL